MAQQQSRAGRPSNSTAQQSRNALDRELAELEKQKMVELRGKTVVLTRDGYLAIAKRWGRR